MLLVRTIFCLALAAALAPAPVAQPTGGPHDESPALRTDAPTTEAPAFWLGGGLGVGGYGLVGQLEAAVQFGPNVFMGRRVGTTDIFASMSATGALYGRATEEVALLAGIGVAHGNRQHPLNEPGAGPEVPPTPGLALHGQWRLGHWGPAGLALSGFANVNDEQSFAGLTLTMQIGRF